MGVRKSYTEKYEDEWFLRMDNDERAVFDWLLHKCDCGGFWKVSDVLLARDTNLKPEEARRVLEGLCKPFKGLCRVMVSPSRGIEGSKRGMQGSSKGLKVEECEEIVWVRNFARLQCDKKELNPKSRYYQGVLKRLIENLSLFPDIEKVYPEVRGYIGVTKGQEGLTKGQEGLIREDKIREEKRSSSLSREGESEGEVSRKTEKKGDPKKTAYPGKGHDELYDRILDEPGLRLTWEAYSGLRKETPDVDWAGLVDYMLMLHVNDGSGGIRNAWAWLTKQVREPKWTKANRRKDVPTVQTREEYENEVI